jgi:repressor LexA
VEDFIHNKGYSPTLEMIAQSLNYNNRASVIRFVKSLQDKQYLKKPDGKNKSIQLADEGQQYCLPLVGKIAAGLPLEACEVLRQIDLKNMLDTPDQFFFEVSGDSMQDIGIVDGDFVLMKKQQLAKPGSIVAAIIDDGEATLKEFYYNNNNTVTLKSYNQAYKDMIYPAERVNIFAIYTGARFDPRIFK